jgi:hypothetical protein
MTGHVAPGAREPATSRPTGRTLAAWLVPLALVAATVWAFAPMLAHELQSDDFGLVLANRDLGLGGVLRFLWAADYGDRQWAYWRPAWVATFWLAHAWFGTEPAPYLALALGLHVACVLGVYTIARRVAGARVLAGAVALLFALHPAHAPAVLWVAAATNVIPAALALLFAAASAWSYARGAPTSRLALAVLLAAASLLWKEAAYGFPIVLLAAMSCGRARGPWSPRDTRLAIAVVAFAALVLLHFRCRNHSSGFAGQVLDMLRVVAASIAGFVRHLAPIPGGDVLLALAVVAAVVVAGALVDGRARFWLAATVAGSVPYVFLTSAGRFAYFIDGPLAILLGACLARWFAVERAPCWSAVAGGAALVLLWCAPTSIGASIAESGREAARAHRIVEALVADGNAAGDRVWVDRVPECLSNGLEAALELRTGRRIHVSALQAFPPRPPFLIHLDIEGRLAQRDGAILRFDEQADRFVSTPVDTFLGGLLPVPVFALCARCRIVADELAARATLRAGAVRPEVEPLLYGAPPAPLDAAATGSIRSISTDIRDFGVTVECSGNMLLVVAFPIPVDFTTPPGAIWIDGAPARVITANVLFHAVVVPGGGARTSCACVSDRVSAARAAGARRRATARCRRSCSPRRRGSGTCGAGSRGSARLRRSRRAGCRARSRCRARGRPRAGARAPRAGCRPRACASSG